MHQLLVLESTLLELECAGTRGLPCWVRWSMALCHTGRIVTEIVTDSQPSDETIAGLLLAALHAKTHGLGRKVSRWKAYQALRQVSWPRALCLMQIVESDRKFYNELASRCYGFSSQWHAAVALLVEARSMLLHGNEDDFFRAGKTCVRAGHWEHTMLGAPTWLLLCSRFLSGPKWA